MEQFGITLYYTNNHPDAHNENFFTASELIAKAQEFDENKDYFITTIEDAIQYLTNEKEWGEIKKTTQYFNKTDIAYIDKNLKNKPIFFNPYIKPTPNQLNTKLKDFIEMHDNIDAFSQAFIDQEKEVTLDGDWAYVAKTQEAKDFQLLNENGKQGFALGHSYTLLNKYLYSPLSKLLKDYDLDVINYWLTYVQLKD